MLDIPFHALNFADAFGRIKDYFVDEYLAGRTPNPCVMCNNWLKFGKLWDFAVSVGADQIATGHYARIQTVDGSPALLRGRDPAKDQSYVLAGINRNILDRILFPVGHFNKPEIRELAAQAGLRVATKPDSQEICFIPDNDYVGFLERYRGRPDMAGDFVDPTGRVLGKHTGYDQFTIGQRRGLGVTFGEPRFVIRIEPETRRVVLGKHEDLACDELEAGRSRLAGRPIFRTNSSVWLRFVTSTRPHPRGLNASLPITSESISATHNSEWPPARPWCCTTRIESSAEAGFVKVPRQRLLPRRLTTAQRDPTRDRFEKCRRRARVLTDSTRRTWVT